MSRRTAAALVVLLGARIAAADPQADAERYYNEGQAAYDAKRYDDAIAAWQKSYELSHLSALVFNLAQAHRLAGHCTQAVDAYNEFIHADPTSPQRADADSRLKEIQPCHDGASAKAPPPPHVDVKPPPPGSDGHGQRVAGVVLVGVGAALAFGGGVFGLQAKSAADEVATACTPHCDWTNDLAAKDSAGRRDVTLQWGLYGAGAAAAIAGIIVYKLGGHERAPVAVVPRADGATVSVLGTW